MYIELELQKILQVFAINSFKAFKPQQKELVKRAGEQWVKRP